MAEDTGESLVMNETIFNFLKKFGWTQVPKNRYVTLVFDMVSIKDVLPTMSKMQNVPTHILLFTVKVISGKGFQPIGNVFLYESTPPWKLSDCIKAYIRDLERCELFVVATVCPPTEYLRSVVENLVEMSTLGNKTDAHIYNVGNINNIVHVYDAPSMLREVRNYLIKKGTVTFKQFGEECRGTYKDVKSVLKRTTSESLKTILELKGNEEVNKYAIKLFSMSVSRELQKATNNGKYRGTANLCSFFDVLFDSFNGNADYDNLNRRPLSSSSTHDKIWRDAIPVLRSMKFLAQEEEEEENSRLRQKQALSDKNVIDVSSEAKRKQKKIKSANRKIQEENSDDRDLNLKENREKQKKKESPGDGDMNKKTFSHVKKNKKKKVNGEVSLDVNQTKTKATDQKIRKEHSDFNQARDSENCSLNENVLQKKTIQPQNSDEKESRNERVGQKKLKTTNQHVRKEQADDSNCTENTKQSKEKKTKEIDQCFGTEHSDSNQAQNSDDHSCVKKKIEATIQPQNSDDGNLNEEKSFIRQEEEKAAKEANQCNQRGHADESNLTENIIPQTEQNKQKKIKETDWHIDIESSDSNQHIQAQNSKDRRKRLKKLKATIQHDDNLNEKYDDEQKEIREIIRPQNSDDGSLNEETSFSRQDKENQHIQPQSTDGNLNETNSSFIKQEEEKKIKATNQYIKRGHTDDDSLTENTSPYTRQEKKKTQVTNQVDNSNKNISLYVKQDTQTETKTTDQHDQVNNSDDRNLNVFPQDKEEEMKPLEIGNVNKRSKQRRLKRRRQLVSNPGHQLVEKLNNHKLNDVSHSSEILTEHSYANTMLEVLNDTQYLDMVLENIDEDINEPPRGNLKIEEKYKGYRKKLMIVLNQSAKSKGGVASNDSNETIAANFEVRESDDKSTNGPGFNGSGIKEIENKKLFVSSNNKNNKKDCVNESISQENKGADSNDAKRLKAEPENPNGVSGRETLRSCGWLYENLLIGNYHGKNLQKMNTSPLSLPKTISQAVEQLKQKRMWDSSSCSDEMSRGNSTNPNCANESKKLGHSTCTSNEDKKNEGTHIRSKSMMEKLNTREKTSDENCPSPLLRKTNLSEIGNEDLSSIICTTNSNSKQINLSDDEQYMDVTEEASDVAANDDGGDDLNEMQNTQRPYVLDAWLISINGMKEINKTMQQNRFQNINTREFNVDCVKYMLHVVGQSNGVDRPCPVEKEDYQVLDNDLVECAFLPEASITLK